MTTKIGIKRTFNLHKYSSQIKDIISEWKIIATIAVSMAGMIAGTLCEKGERGSFGEFPRIIFNYMINTDVSEIYTTFLYNLLLPTILFVVIFFCGLSAYGVLISYFIPFGYSMLIGMLTYYLYSDFMLKGLAFFVILILPFATLSLLGIVLMTVDSINMSQGVLNVLGNANKRYPYNFSIYYKSALRNYIIIIISAIIKTILDNLFIGIFSF